MKLSFILLLLLVGCSIKEINYDEGLYKGKVKENIRHGEGKLSSKYYIYEGVWEENLLVNGQIYRNVNNEENPIEYFQTDDVFISQYYLKTLDDVKQATTWEDAIRILKTYQIIYKYTETEYDTSIINEIKKREDLIAQKKEQTRLKDLPKDVIGYWEGQNIGEGGYGTLVYIKFNDDNTGFIKNKTIYPNTLTYDFTWDINSNYKFSIDYNDEQYPTINNIDIFVSEYKDKFYLGDSSVPWLNGRYIRTNKYNEVEIWEKINPSMTYQSVRNILGNPFEEYWIGDNYIEKYVQGVSVTYYKSIILTYVQAPDGNYINNGTKPRW